MRTGSRLARLDDERLAALVGRGDAAAFETLYDRHHGALLAFCRHMVGDRQDGEDALQQAFLRAHRALVEGRAPDRVRPWLFAIARNRCLTLLAARRNAAVPVEEVEASFDGLSSEVERRADLRELVSDLARLPDDQRGALVLAELGDFSHAEIARVVGCPPAKVKALVFQARTTLIADRDARRTPCDEIRALLETARGGVLRRGALRRHLRQCDPCAAYRLAMESRRTGLALILPVVPTAGLKAAVLGGGAESAAAAAALGGVGGGAAGAAGGGAGSAGLVAPTATSGAASAALVAPTATSGGGIVAAKALVAKAAVAVAIGAGAAGGAVAVHDETPERRTPPSTIERAADRPSEDRTAPAAARESASQQPVSDSAPAAAVVPTAQERPRRRRVAALRRFASESPAVRHRIRRRLVRATPRQRARLRARVGVIVRSVRPLRRRHRRREAQPPPVPTPTLRPHRRRRDRPVATPTPAATAEPAPAAAVSPSPEPTATATATPTPGP